MNYEKQSFSSEDVERRVLGCMIKDTDCFDACMLRLSEDDFFGLQNRNFFHYLKQMKVEGVPWSDLVAVSEWLDRHDATAAAGGSQYVIGLFTDTPSAANWEYFVLLIGSNANARRSRSIVQKALDDLSKAGADTAAVLAKMHDQIEALPSYSAQQSAVYMASDIEGKEFTQQEPIIDGLLYPGLTVLGAKQKMGKSWLSLDLSMCISSGTAFWGRTSHQCPVLYCDLEGSQAQISQRFSAMRRKLCDFPNIGIVHDVPTLDNGLIGFLENQWFKDHPDSRCVIIDTWRFVAGASLPGENAYETSYRQASILQKYAKRKGVAIIVITHLKKSNANSRNTGDIFEEIMGGSGLPSAADASWVIVGNRYDETRDFLSTGRDLQPDPMTLRFNHDQCRWECLGTARQVAEAKRREEWKSLGFRDAVLSLLDDAAKLQKPCQYTAAAILDRWAELTGGRLPMDFSDETAPRKLGKRLAAEFKSALFDYDGITVCKTPPQRGVVYWKFERLHLSETTEQVPFEQA